MNEELRQMVIEALRRGEELPAEWGPLLFPPQKREYELTYVGKDREEEIIASTLAVPLQPVRTFGKVEAEDAWRNMLIFGDNLQSMKTLLEMKSAGKLLDIIGINLSEDGRSENLEMGGGRRCGGCANRKRSP
ncbi:MAG: hypothetical protein HY328_14330 [Chloroflexi bacterium]|nr:hypothetical protein [Chloroflexota bacterium]